MQNTVVEWKRGCVAGEKRRKFHQIAPFWVMIAKTFLWGAFRPPPQSPFCTVGEN